MNTQEITISDSIGEQLASYKKRSRLSLIVTSALAALIAFGVFYSSLIATSEPITAEQYSKVNDAIAILEAKGFQREAYLLRNTAEFRRSDHWLNDATLHADYITPSQAESLLADCSSLQRLLISSIKTAKSNAR